MRLSVLDVAKICHEANRALCEAQGDSSQLPFEESPTWQVESAVNGVEAILDGRTTEPSVSHECWSKEKLDNGWKYGEVKDAALKTHPCLVPFDELPIEQQSKDYLFFSIVKALAPIVTTDDEHLWV